MAISRRKRLELLKDVSAAFLQLRKAISSISDADLTRPNTVGVWSGKDMIAHIADWERAYTEVLRNRAANESEQWPAPDDSDAALDAWNQAQVTARADWELADVLEYFDQTHADLMEMLEQVPDLDPAESAEYTRWHYNAHYDDLMACRSKRPG